MREIKSFLFIAPLLLLLTFGCGTQKNILTVSEVIRNADSLDGQTIRVRGQAYLWIDPSREEMWMFGGCAINPDGSPSEGGSVSGWLELYDQIDPDDLKNYGAPHNDRGIKIAESSFDCKGNYCKMTCRPFEVVSDKTYELVGALRVKEGPELILENIDLDRSRQMVNGSWLPVSTGNFDVMFP
jgi:hypothetical protein